MKKAILFILMMLGFSVSPVFAAPTVSLGSAVVDGDPSEWLPSDFYANMYEAGDPSKDVLSKLYLRYSCKTDTLYALVLVTDNVTSADTESGTAWIKIHELGESPQVGDEVGNFAWIYDDETPIGYEASFGLDPGNYNTFEAHINVTYDKSSGNTSSTGKKKEGYITLSINCKPNTVPVPGAILLLGAGLGGLSIARRKRLL